MLGAVTEVMAAGYLAPLEQKRSFPSNCLGLSEIREIREITVLPDL